MQQVKRARPSSWGASGRAGTAATVDSGQMYSTTNYEPPIALGLTKNGRFITPYKIVPLNNEMVLAQAVRNQFGTEKAVSIPLIVLSFAEKAGIRWFVWRHDRRMEMKRILLTNIRRRGNLRPDREFYFPLSFMQSVPWATWSYADRVVRLGPTVPEPDGRQMMLFGAYS